jgi:hypothetical protein
MRRRDECLLRESAEKKAIVVIVPDHYDGAVI